MTSTISARPRLRSVFTALTVVVAFSVAGGAAPAVATAPDRAAQARAAASSDTHPDFGQNVTILDPGMSTDAINAALAAAGNEDQFGIGRHAILFKPGSYGSAAGQDDPSTATGIVNGQIGYYESVAGLGERPDDVTINGALHSEGNQTSDTPWDNDGDSVESNFWRSISNLAINPIQQPVGADAARANPEGIADPHTLRWAVSQSSPLRRVDILGDLSLFPRFGSFSSGGYISGSKVAGQVISGSQQQWYTRDSSIGSWKGSVWNMVFSGVQGAPAQSFPVPTSQAGPYNTTLQTTPVSRDAPFLYINEAGAYKVFVPDARRSASGADWDPSDGTAIPIHDFFIAKPTDSADRINAALASGKNLILTPGIYKLTSSIRVTRSDTVVLGLGFATLTPTRGTPAITTTNVHGVKIAGIIVDAGARRSATLVKIGSRGDRAASASDPTTLNDVFLRVGGAEAGAATTGLEVNSAHVLLDDIWAWRADHGLDGTVGWRVNRADHGVVVNGDHVTALGLAVEHFQKTQVVWNGNHGETIFFQSELPYDPPSQAAWKQGSVNGYAAYAVGDCVTSHSAWGLGVYSNFTAGPQIVSTSAITAPNRRGVKFTDVVTRYLAGNGGITHVINRTGAAVNATSPQTDLAGY